MFWESFILDFPAFSVKVKHGGGQRQLGLQGVCGGCGPVCVVLAALVLTWSHGHMGAAGTQRG